MIQLPSPTSLAPMLHPIEGCAPLAYFPTATTPLLKLDLRFEAGSAYQPSFLCSAAACNLFTIETARRSSEEVAEWIDARGIVVEPDTDIFAPGISLYFHRRHLPDLLPLVEEWLCEPHFSEANFEVYRGKRRLAISTDMQKTASVARRMFYESLFGRNHILGCYATPEDADRLALGEVEAFFRQRFVSPTVAAAGAVEEEELALLRKYIPRLPKADGILPSIEAVPPSEGHSAQRLVQPMEGAAQTTVRIGRILPLRWDEPDYADFMLLSTVLGGYFGSRLMTNIREEKGYTYGIYSTTQIYRGCILFYIVADVAAGTAEATVNEVMNELRRLQREPIAADELERVCTVLAADFLRSVDGVFECSARYLDMLATSVDETLTANLSHTLAHATPDTLQALAKRFLRPEDMTTCLAGVV